MAAALDATEAKVAVFAAVFAPVVLPVAAAAAELLAAFVAALAAFVAACELADEEVLLAMLVEIERSSAGITTPKSIGAPVESVPTARPELIVTLVGAPPLTIDSPTYSPAVTLLPLESVPITVSGVILRVTPLLDALAIVLLTILEPIAPLTPLIA